MNLFAAGMLHLAAHDFDACLACLHRSIELNHDFNWLNEDRAKVITAAEEARAEVTARGANASAPGSGAQAAQHVLLAGYQPQVLPDT